MCLWNCQEKPGLGDFVEYLFGFNESMSTKGKLLVMMAPSTETLTVCRRMQTGAFS